jgi:hypothetical protein
MKTFKMLLKEGSVSPLYIRIQLMRNKKDSGMFFKITKIFEDQHGVIEKIIKRKNPDTEFYGFNIPFGGQIYINGDDDLESAKDLLVTDFKNSLDLHCKTVQAFKTNLVIEGYS